jgi:hypothetical protein
LDGEIMVKYKALRFEQFIARGILSAFFIAAVVFVNMIIPADPGLELIRFVGLTIYSFVVIFMNLYMGIEHTNLEGKAAVQTVA